MKREITIEPIEKLPWIVKTLLYLRRLRYDADTPYDKFIGYYEAVFVDDVVYLDKPENSTRNGNLYYLLRNNFASYEEIARLVDAFYIKGYLIKNRYGTDSLNKI